MMFTHKHAPISSVAGETYTPPGKMRSLLLWTILAAAGLVVLLVSTVELTMEQQLLFALASLGLSLFIRNGDEVSRYRIMLLIAISVIASGRYIYWRITETMGWFGPSPELSFADQFFSIGLLLAEMYAWTVLILGYIQTLWPLNREVMPLPRDKNQWPSIDVYIPTYNEPLQIVSPSVMAARDLDWPADKLNVYILDDGCRPEFKQFAEQAGVNYIERHSSEGAKAGNINHALQITKGKYIAIFDCDHVPVRSFLTKTVGWFLKDKNLGLVQTPHLFFTPDPVERNLQIYHRVPNEGQLFYGLIQDGNDAWNSTFFCGSCAVLARDALLEVGGIATETVTEDAHTALKMQKKGWNSAYLNLPLAAGLATERLSDHIGQRRRWARGMTQILRRDNPLFTRGLKLAQRLTYFNAMMHFLFSLPRLIFLTAPLAYLFFEIYVVQTTAALIAVYALPHIFQAQVANAVMQGRYRHSFWAEVYETILAPHILFPTLHALVRPKEGEFNVTDKGGDKIDDHFDWHSSKTIFFILLLNVAGIIIGLFRLIWWNNGDEIGTVILNLSWTVYNTIIVGAALAVAWEKRQRRSNSRIHRNIKAWVQTLGGEKIQAKTHDISTGDISLNLESHVALRPGDQFSVILHDENKTTSEIQARVANVRENHIGAKLILNNADQLAEVVYFTHSKDGSWDGWYIACDPSKPISSLIEIVHFGLGGAFKALFGQSKSDNPQGNFQPNYALSSWLLVFVLVASTGIFTIGGTAHAAEINNADITEPVLTTTELPFKKLGVQSDIQLRGGNTQDDVWFSLRADKITKEAQLQLQYKLSTDLLPDYETLAITLNGQPVAQVSIQEYATPGNDLLHHTFSIDPLYVSNLNQLSFKLIPSQKNYCEKLEENNDYAIIDKSSSISLLNGPLNLVNDLALFPKPFFDTLDDKRLILPMIFSHQIIGSTQTSKAASIIASWFGAQADYRGAEFPVFLTDKQPQQHSILFLTPDTHVDYLQPITINGPGIAIQGHASMPHVKLLIVYGRNTDELVQAASTLVSGTKKLSGSNIVFSEPYNAPKSVAYDAPRWLKAGEKTRFGDLVDGEENLIARGLSPNSIPINFRIPPDLFDGNNLDIPINLDYSYTTLPLSDRSKLYVNVNNDIIQENIRLNNQKNKKKMDTQKTMIQKKELLFFNMTKLAGINTIDFYYSLHLPEENGEECLNEYSDAIVGKINPNSNIDLTGYAHYARYPNIAMFANIGFPFTRYADLSRTSIVLPNQPTTQDIQTVLTIMGKMGESTGHPAYHANIIFADQIASAKNNEILVIGDPERQPLFEQWKAHFPVIFEQNALNTRKISIPERIALWWNGEQTEEDNAKSTLAKIATNERRVITSFRSPLNNQRTVVALMAQKSEALPGLVTAMIDPNLTEYFQNDITVVNAENKVNNFQMLASYYLGDLPIITTIRSYFSNHLTALILLCLAVITISAAATKALMRAHRHTRYDMEAPNI